MRRLVIRIDDEEHLLTAEPGASFASASIPCPHCREPLRVIGSERTIGGYDYYKAPGYCGLAKCAKFVGEIRAYVSTIFGLEEDERVLHGRWRVY